MLIGIVVAATATVVVVVVVANFPVANADFIKLYLMKLRKKYLFS